MKNNIKDMLLKSSIIISVIITLGSLLFIVGFIFVKGLPYINLDFFINQYDPKTSYVMIDNSSGDLGLELEPSEEGLIIKNISKTSPLNDGVDLKNHKVKVSQGDYLISFAGYNYDELSLEEMNTLIKETREQVRIKVTLKGEGIFPMLVSTLMIIVLSLLIAAPIGIFTAIYLAEYAKGERLVKIIRFSIECLAGIPSIIYGLFGMLLFVTYLKFQYSILAGALTVSIILLPVIIRTTEETLKTVPQSFREGSLGLGATKIQTIIKVVLPSAISGIITAIILSIGRIIGESAALILTAGTVARIPNSLFQSASTLTVKAYTVAKEEGNIGFACAIGIVIIILVALINYMAKRLGQKLVNDGK